MNNKQPGQVNISIDALRSGDPQAFSELYLSLYPPLCFFAERLLHDKAKAEEIVAGVFEKLWQNRQAIKQVDNIKPYLYQAVRNNCIKLLDRGKRRSILQKDMLQQTPVSEDYILQNMFYAEALREVSEAVSSLPAQRRKVITMMYGEGYKAHEIAEQLGLSIETVKRHRNLGIAELKKLLSKRALAIAIIVFNSMQRLCP